MLSPVRVTAAVRAELHTPVNKQTAVFTTSNKWAAKLRTLQPANDDKGVLTVVSQRWGSSYDAYERLQLLRQFITLFYNELPSKPTAPLRKLRERRFSGWLPLAQVISILKPFRSLVTTLQRRDLCMGEAMNAVLAAYITLHKPFEVPTFTSAGECIGTSIVQPDELTSTAAAVLARLRWELETRIIHNSSYLSDMAVMAIRLDPLCGEAVLTTLDQLRTAQDVTFQRDARAQLERADAAVRRATAAGEAAKYCAQQQERAGDPDAAAKTEAEAATAQRYAAADQQRAHNILRAAMARPKSRLLQHADELLDQELRRLGGGRGAAEPEPNRPAKRPKTGGYQDLQLPAGIGALAASAAMPQPAAAGARGSAGGGAAAAAGARGGAGGGGAGVRAGSSEHPQLSAYRTEAQALRESAPEEFSLFAFWRERDVVSGAQSSPYPLVAVIARRVLAMRPTSVDPERNFSDAGVLVSAKRSRLHPAKVEVSLFVKTNKDLVPDNAAVPKLANPAANMPDVFSADFDTELPESEPDSDAASLVDVQSDSDESTGSAAHM
jgi:hypothetical protein